MSDVLTPTTNHFVRTEVVNGVPVPTPPETMEDTGIQADFLADLALKIAAQVPRCSTRWTAQRICLPMQLTEELLMTLNREHLLDVLGEDSPGNHRYALTQLGRDRVREISETCAYAGPAPVTLESYTEWILRQEAAFPKVTLEDVREAVSDLVLSEEKVLVAAMAVSSHRSLFLWGEAGNGKTSLAVALHHALHGDLWMPHCINIENEVLKLYDPIVHDLRDPPTDESWRIDQRWVRIRRPLVVAGGEMTIDSLELTHQASRGFYEMPLHVKANGGAFVVDDFGRQRVDPAAFLNRWIVPMETGHDYLPLPSGRKVQVPFKQLLVVATNLEPKDVTDPAFLRRMGYRLHLGPPDEATYRDIFESFLKRRKLEAPPDLLDHVINKYYTEGRELRSCEPRDLVLRAEDICNLRDEPARLDNRLVDLAWIAYFGDMLHGDATS